MTKREQISFYKQELAVIETSKEVLKQSLSVITRREDTLKSALEKLGSKVPTRKGKSILSENKKLELIASLTK